MAFTVPEIEKVVEFRGLNTGVSGNGKQWMSLKVEFSSQSGVIDWEITVPTELQGEVYSSGIAKGNICDVVFVARAGRTQQGRDYSYLQLQRAPRLIEVDEDGVLS